MHATLSPSIFLYNSSITTISIGMFLIYKHHACFDIPYDLLCLLSVLPSLTQCLLNSAISYRIFTAVLLSEVTILFSPAQHHS